MKSSDKEDLDVIFVDNHLLAVNKPAGILTQPSGTQQKNVEDIAKKWIKNRFNKPGNVFLEAVHRLDKAVSGVVLFGRTSKAVSRLNASIRKHECKKTYIAIVEGNPANEEGILEHYLVHDNYRAHVTENPETPKAKLAKLSYKLLRTDSAGSLVEIHLITGRYHQIRVQFAAIGCPIVGDSKYGSTIAVKGPGIALHHCSLEIMHPVKHVILQLVDKDENRWCRDFF